MAQQPFKIGTLYISHEVLQHEKWLTDQVISAAMSQLSKYKGQDGFLKPSTVRKGDYSLLLSEGRLSPTVAIWIGIPGKARAAIVQELFVVSAT